MHKTGIIKKPILIENIVGIYRNRVLLNQRRRKLVKIRIFIESCLAVAAFVFLTSRDFRGFSFAKLDWLTYIFSLCYTCFSMINRLAPIVLSYVTSHNFKEFVFNVSAVHNMYENDETHKSFVKRQQRRFYFDILLFAIAMSFTASSFIYDFLFIVPSKSSIIMFVYEISKQYCFFYENFVFFECMEIIVLRLSFLNESISVVIDNLNNELNYNENDGDLREIRGKLENWAKASRLLVTANANLCKCFEIQLTISLCSVTIYYIALLYQGVKYVTNPNVLTTANTRSNMLELINYVIIKILIVNAGQRAQNEAEDLHRNICALNNLLVWLPGAEACACARLACGLARRLRAAPLRVRLLSSLAVQMALLADMLALVANYTIVLLQFNHVL